MQPVVCPRCQHPESRRAGFTWWGGVLGGKLLHHVYCIGCGHGYNGKTGGSNTAGIVIYSVVLTVFALALFFVLWR